MKMYFLAVKVKKAEEFRKWEKSKGGKHVRTKFIHTYPGYLSQMSSLSPNYLETSDLTQCSTQCNLYNPEYIFFSHFPPTGLSLEVTLQKLIVWNKMSCSGIRNVFLFHISFYVLREKERVFFIRDSNNHSASLSNHVLWP